MSVTIGWRGDGIRTFFHAAGCGFGRGVRTVAGFGLLSAHARGFRGQQEIERHDSGRHLAALVRSELLPVDLFVDLDELLDVGVGEGTRRGYVL